MELHELALLLDEVAGGRHTGDGERPEVAARVTAGRDGWLEVRWDDEVLRLDVRRVARLRVPVEAQGVAHVGDVRVDVVEVCVDTCVDVLLRGTGPAADAAVEAHRRTLAQWEWDVASGDPDDPPSPPPWPGEALLGLGLHVESPVGTALELDRAEAGGEGREWEARLRFSPAPPDGVTVVAVRVGEATVVVPLTPGVVTA